MLVQGRKCSHQLPYSYDILQQYWQGFTETGRVPDIRGAPGPSCPPIMAACAPLDPLRSTTARASWATRRCCPSLRTQTNLITIAIPLMEDVFQFIEGSDCPSC